MMSKQQVFADAIEVNITIRGPAKIGKTTLLMLLYGELSSSYPHVQANVDDEEILIANRELSIAEECILRTKARIVIREELTPEIVTPES